MHAKANRAIIHVTLFQDSPLKIMFYGSSLFLTVFKTSSVRISHHCELEIYALLAEVIQLVRTVC